NPGGASATPNPIIDLEFDINGDGVPDATGMTDAQGNFTFTPLAGTLHFGNATIAARSVVHGPTGLLHSAWKTVSFSYTPPPVAVPSVLDLRLAHVDGTSANTTSDPTVTGRLSFPPPASTNTTA